jgi:hypothetical protein
MRNPLVLCVLLAGLPFHTYGQQATVVGTVTDPSGEVVPNEAITFDRREVRSADTFFVVDIGSRRQPLSRIAASKEG